MDRFPSVRPVFLKRDVSDPLTAKYTKYTAQSGSLVPSSLMHCVALPRVASEEEPMRNLPKIAIYGRGYVPCGCTRDRRVCGDWRLPSYQWGDSNSDPRRSKALMAFVLGPRALPGLPYSSRTRRRRSSGNGKLFSGFVSSWTSTSMSPD